jgi:hypothetical protein
MIKQKTAKAFFLAAVALALCIAPALPALAGPYSPAAGKSGSNAVPMNFPEIAAWASFVQSVEFGSHLDNAWKNTANALGPASGTAFVVVSLGRGGRITLGFDPPIANGPGWDFAVFSNSFSDTFLELAFVEVSSDGANFFRFPSRSLTREPVAGYGNLDPTDVDGLAGNFRQGFGTPFDLTDLLNVPGAWDAIAEGRLDLGSIAFVRIVDIVGDGSAKDSSGSTIYDPYPTFGSAGFDLDAVAARYTASAQGQNRPPLAPLLFSPANNAAQAGFPVILETGPFADPDSGDSQTLAHWQISSGQGLDFEQNLVLDALTPLHLTTLEMWAPLFLPGRTYAWRVRHFDSRLAPSPWPEAALFTTEAQGWQGVPPEQAAERAWTGDEALDAAILTIQALNSAGRAVVMGIAPVGNVAQIVSARALPLDSTALKNRPALSTGLMGFMVVAADPQKPVQVDIHLDPPAPPGSAWYKHDPISGWRPFPHARFAADGKTVRLTLVDGDPERGDIDRVANSVIVDPGGAVFGRNTPVPPSQPAGIGSSSGCFVNCLAADKNSR